MKRKYYIQSKILLVIVEFDIILEKNYTESELLKIKKLFTTTLDELGKNITTSYLLKEYANKSTKGVERILLHEKSSDQIQLMCIAFAKNKSLDLIVNDCSCSWGEIKKNYSLENRKSKFSCSEK